MHTRVVICGSYHQGADELQRTLRELEATGCHVLSPLSISFMDNRASFVRTVNEEYFSVLELEKFHLRAIREADFIWLHTPNGYVGLSGSYEIGYAKAIGKPVFCRLLPSDEMLATQVIQTSSVFNALDAIAKID